METIINLLKEKIEGAFEEAGYDKKYGFVTLSKRPDLCQYQCNGALPAAKEYKKAPINIAQNIVDLIQDDQMFKEVEPVMPGFINIKLSDEFITNYLNDMNKGEWLGCKKEETPKTIVVDYGGPNIAKPLHVGHMRSAVIGESIKRILRFMGNEVIGDAHLGDWGLQMGLVIAELKKRQPSLPYFDESFAGEYPKEAPFTISELEEIYPAANEFAKGNPEFNEEAKEITFLLQNGHKGYRAVWNHMLDISVTDLKEIYQSLNVSFDLWKKESDAQPYIPDMIKYMKENNYTRISDGALVVDVKREDDNKEVPPCMILKSDGATLYNTTDLATIVERMKLFSPDRMIYITDKRQGLYFEQIFRCARKTKLIDDNVQMDFIGFGTMNGKDGKPFKTRDGGVMRLENLIKGVTDEVYNKILENRKMDELEAKVIATKVGIGALKYGDLSNQASKDYVFDLDRFTSFEGDTGPYILYTIVRIKSILDKYKESGKEIGTSKMLPASTDNQRNLMLELIRFNETIYLAYEETAPHRLCQYVYNLSNAFNSFYHETKILTEEDEAVQSSYIDLLSLTHKILNLCIDLLGIEAPDRM